MSTFRTKWHKKPIEDWVTTCSDDYKAFCRSFKSFLKRSYPDCEIIGFAPNHYHTCGFINFGDVIVFVSHDMDRAKGYIDFDAYGAMDGVLYRLAASTKDYSGRGGVNNFTSLSGLTASIDNLVSAERSKRGVTPPTNTVVSQQPPKDKVRKPKDKVRKVVFREDRRNYKVHGGCVAFLPDLPTKEGFISYVSLIYSADGTLYIMELPEHPLPWKMTLEDMKQHKLIRKTDDRVPYFLNYLNSIDPEYTYVAAERLR